MTPLWMGRHFAQNESCIMLQHSKSLRRPKGPSYHEHTSKVRRSFQAVDLFSAQINYTLFITLLNLKHLHEIIP